MNISTRSQYGLRALLYLAKQDKRTSIKDISTNLNISFNYLQRIFINLKEQNIVNVERGAQGGYALNHEPHKITLYDIIHCLEPNFALVNCLQDQDSYCRNQKQCLSKHVWHRLNVGWITLLKSITLAEAL